jgi:hypothetical protein
MGTRGSSCVGKAASHEADHSPPSGAKVKKAWSYISTPQYTFMAWCSVKKMTGTTLPYLYIFLYLTVVTKYLNFITFLKDLLAVSKL